MVNSLLPFSLSLSLSLSKLSLLSLITPSSLSPFSLSCYAGVHGRLLVNGPLYYEGLQLAPLSGSANVAHRIAVFLSPLFSTSSPHLLFFRILRNLPSPLQKKPKPSRDYFVFFKLYIV
ncbi:hypothetical protein O6H91_04G048900 [Diphasiastrum complanatum]|uniref:Uncharacterized protein n=1 Tax=Diphasiastrum complanatum TaxID=34168 RepID=A0ACC2DWH5_DIPCM|nr:hypothetical protein O6H91_04G048900 [Diphasiastrum complanatum]